MGNGSDGETVDAGCGADGAIVSYGFWDEDGPKEYEKGFYATRRQRAAVWDGKETTHVPHEIAMTK